MFTSNVYVYKYCLCLQVLSMFTSNVYVYADNSALHESLLRHSIESREILAYK